MGYMRHHAIVVTSYKEDLLEQARAVAAELGMSVSAITDEVTNGYRSFLVAPDGSKEGWDTSSRGDEQRAKFAAWLTAQAYDDGSTSLGWVEVQFADDEGESVIVRDSDELRRRRWAEEDEQTKQAADELAALEERVGAKWAAAALARTQTWPAIDLDAFNIDTWLVNPGPDRATPVPVPTRAVGVISDPPHGHAHHVRSATRQGRRTDRRAMADALLGAAIRRQDEGGVSVILGMTGTRNLLSECQLQWLLEQVRGADELHHGACVGADASAHRAALRCRVQVVVHPPVDQRLAMTMGQLLSVHGGVAILSAKPYHVRNRDIVKACDRLIALPDGPQRAHSGTWYTVAYATGGCDVHLAERIVPVTICYPDGTVEHRPADEPAWSEFLNRRVAVWHESRRALDGIPLHAFLGMTWDEYKAWTEAKTIPNRLVAGARP